MPKHRGWRVGEGKFTFGLGMAWRRTARVTCLARLGSFMASCPCCSTTQLSMLSAVSPCTTTSCTPCALIYRFSLRLFFWGCKSTTALVRFPCGLYGAVQCSGDEKEAHQQSFMHVSSTLKKSIPAQSKQCAAGRVVSDMIATCSQHRQCHISLTGSLNSSGQLNQAQVECQQIVEVISTAAVVGKSHDLRPRQYACYAPVCCNTVALHADPQPHAWP